MKQLMQRFKHRSSVPISRACRRPRAITALLLAGLLGIVAAADEARIANEFLEVRADGQRFTVTSLMAGPAIGVAGVLEAGAGIVFRGEEAADDQTFGPGRRLVFDRLGADGTGGRVALEVYPELPFVLVRQSVRNSTGQPVNFRKLFPVSLTVDLGRPASGLVTLGTGGLLPPDKNPGSYLFLLCADPATRASVVTGWLTQFKGSGTVFSSVNAEGAVGLRAQIEHGHLLLDPGQSADLDTFVIGGFADGRIGAERLADAIARAHQVKLKPRTAVYCSWYADQFGGAGTEASTVELGRFIARELKPHGMTVIQIDDEWQSGAKFNGPRRGFLEPRRDGPYPNGFEGVTRALAAEGLTFGLWTLPFARNHQDPEYRDRQHWFAQRLDGKPYDTPWGGTCLDLTHPEVREQIAALATAQRDWGVRYFKLDGLWTGAVCEQIYINDGFKEDHFGNHRPLHDPTVTNHAFDFWAAKPAPELLGSWSCELPPVSCRILALRARENHPVLVSTSRHVTQGMVDVESESWDAANRSLRLRVRLTGGDPNELRVAGLADGPGWAFARAAVAPEDTAAGVQIESLPQTEPGWQRVRLLSPTSRTVAVTLAFAAEETDARRVAVAGTPLVFTMPEAGPRPMDKQRE